MAFQKSDKKGAIILPNLLADILAAEAAGLLTVGHFYATTDQTEERIGRAVLANKIEWTVLASDVAAAVLVEKTRAQGVESTLISTISAEVSRAQGAESTLASSIASEVSRAQGAESTLTSSIAAEVSRAQGAESTLTSSIAAEVSRAQGVEANLFQNITAEEQRATVAEAAIASGLAAEIVRAQAAEAAIAANLASEVTRATGREDSIDTAYKAADAALETALTTVFNNALTAYASKDVRSVIKAAYANNGTLSLATLVGVNPVDGVHAIFCTSDNLANVATMTSPIALATGEEIVDFGDQYDVTTIGGTITKVVKIESILKAKFGSIDAAITDLQAATTATAIRGHFSATGWATLTNGLFEVTPSTAPNNDLATSLVDGKAFLDVDQTKTTAGPNGEQTLNTQFVDLWAQVTSITQNGAFGASNGTNKNGSNVELGGVLTKDTAITGDKTLTLPNTVVDGEFKLPIWRKVNGVRTKILGLVDVWFDEDGINYKYPNPDPNA